MGLGPSTKMTSLFHFNCPIVRELLKHSDIEVPGVIVAGVSENYLEKVFTAQRVGNLLDALKPDGVIVVTDAWGNHHVDFVSVIEEVGKRGIPSVGMGFFGLQGRLVYTSEYLETLIDLNKGTTGYESCVIGENNLSELDAHKAVAILKNKISKKKDYGTCQSIYPHKRGLTRKFFTIEEVVWGDQTKIEGDRLIVKKNLPDFSAYERWIEKVEVILIRSGERGRFVNSNLDFFPIASKVDNSLGEGITHVIQGVAAMITGVEKTSHFQPANIGSSEGILSEQVEFNTAGTPRMNDTIINIDLLFKEGEGRTRDGIRAAHKIADTVINSIRKELKKIEARPVRTEKYNAEKKTAKKIVLVKSVSGLGNMYETAMFPDQPGGYLGAYSTMDFMNMPVVVTANQVLDGVIHSLI
ncbi:Glycine/sarcosine/betaine reductase component B subunits [Enterococcus malodoratus]|uniref:glycine/sarcosine/betaine reductase component B subunit n=1 Tax=Enterococcus malodoratus TaxID=71451 RepID=UPI0008B87F64|nr:glycine/sarcosine/betaine reductase component B subunit [Enterococcus malodoratus]SET19487.1 Glycine/sarcosine/betaine reductase component B subunits [Enterococcus malodoratus]